MSSFKRQGQHRNTARKSAAILFGLGLILIGVMVALLLIKPGGDQSSSSSASASSRYSVTPVEVSFPAPELSLEKLDGDLSSLEDFRGQVILINNWATWCPPCKAEMPDLQAYYEKHREQGFLLIGIESGESASEVAQFVANYQLTFPIWLDLQGIALQVFQNFNLPNSYVIDRTGIVRLTWTGAIREDVLEHYVTPLLKEE
jgi:cytochrome c biogenesis protein CcmG/thiol:disulfide interchange protein DsbE